MYDHLIYPAVHYGLTLAAVAACWHQANRSRRHNKAARRHEAGALIHLRNAAACAAASLGDQILGEGHKEAAEFAARVAGQHAGKLGEARRAESRKADDDRPATLPFPDRDAGKFPRLWPQGSPGEADDGRTG